MAMQKGICCSQSAINNNCFLTVLKVFDDPHPEPTPQTHTPRSYGAGVAHAPRGHRSDHTPYSCLHHTPYSCP
eukprot:6708471-Heterocapsa_arctica.AAC.1